MACLYSLTMFVSAMLLFQIQPLVGKMLLPKLGGTPAVWNTCLVFFQAALLAGYAYAHASIAVLGTKRQSIVHILILLGPLAMLPIVVGDDSFRSGADNPALTLIRELVSSVGLPFCVVAATAPMLQRWFSTTAHRSAHDPYFLYAASNLGSMLALVAYPLVIEPNLTLFQQTTVWTWAYVAFGILVVACAVSLQLSSRSPSPDPKAPIVHANVSRRTRLRWVALAFVPSSLLLGATTYLSMDIAPIPLLWVVPLGLYLVSFIIVFSRRPLIRHSLMTRLLPIAVLVLTLVLITGATDVRGMPPWVLLAIHLGVFFIVAMVGHGELARSRPESGQLTEFYLWMSVGGVLGGMFNALVAPIIFRKTGLTEYPLALVLACFMCPPRSILIRPTGLRDFVYPALVGLTAVALIRLSFYLEIGSVPLRMALCFGLPCVLAYLFVDRPVRFALGIGSLLLTSAFNPAEKRQFLERSFFGIVKVAEVRGPDGRTFRAMFHGNTIHGQKDLERVDADGRHVPLTYYHPSGPIGVACRKWFAHRPTGMSVGAVGLGTGSIAYYARAGDRWTFFEIDPTIRDVASDSAYFSFLSECRTGMPRVVIGDALLRLQEQPDHSFDFLVLDAFSSDSIPIHLMTREALAMYMRKLRPRGVMAFHISNRYLNLRPILARLAEDAGFAARAWRDWAGDPSIGKFESEWVIVARADADFGPIVFTVHGRTGWIPTVRITEDRRWEPCRSKPGTPLWTNEFSNLLSALGRDEEDP